MLDYFLVQQASRTTDDRNSTSLKLELEPEPEVAPGRSPSERC